jgi:streptogramin lyase
MPPPVTTYPGVSFTGSVKAGTQPLAGATVQLYAAGTTGSGSAGTTLLNGALTTDSSGAFTVPAGYGCPLATSQIYAVARGGSIAGVAANSSIALLTTLGSCSQVTASEHIVVNEVTTVANAWALAQFLAAGGNIGASSTNTMGLGNAVATAASLVNPLTGTVPGATFPANGVSPAARLNSLANLLNTCTSAASGSSACTSLLSTSLNTLDAALRIVRSPGTNVAALYTQSTASTAFSPVLAAAPNDWTLFVTFGGGGLFLPTGIAIDSNGNVWVGDYGMPNNSGSSIGLVTEFSPVGLSLFPSGITGFGLNNVFNLAIDAQNNVWVPNQQSDPSVNGGVGSVTELSSSGQAISGATGYTAGGLIYPIAIGIDPDGSVWVVNEWKTSIAKLSSTGLSLSGTTGIVGNSFRYPASIVVDSSHNAWVGDTSDGVVTEVSSDGKTITPYTCCNAPAGLAIDQGGNIWAANFEGKSVTELSSSGTDLSNGGYVANGALSGPQGIKVDGSGNVWVSNFYGWTSDTSGSVLAEIAGASSTTPGKSLTPAAGWAPEAGLHGAFANAIDASGNLWITNEFGGNITEFIGIAGPVKTPQIGPPQTP